MFVNVVLGGTYQRTRDERALVWNNHPKPGDEATWSGNRDSDGYASGFGTLIWYTTEADSTEPALYARYWGNMTRGKFNGTVNVHSKRKTHYAVFVDGARSTRWAAGPAPSRMPRPSFAEAMRRAFVASNVRRVEPDVPAEGPGLAGVPGRSEIEPERKQSLTSRPATIEWSQSAPDIDDSLRILVWPPRSLRTR
jgi:hypothetical protein